MLSLFSFLCIPFFAVNCSITENENSFLKYDTYNNPYVYRKSLCQKETTNLVLVQYDGVVKKADI